MEKKKLRVFKLQIDPEDQTGVTTISLVNDPAIMKNFITFSADQHELKFAITNLDKQIVTGPIMVPELPIYRNTKDSTGNIIDEWYVVADKPLIAAVIQKYFKQQRTTNTSLEHDGALLNGVYLIESFQVDKSRGILAPVGYGVIPDGTWFGSIRIEDPDIWSQVKSGPFKGFSIEGLFTYVEQGAIAMQPADLKPLDSMVDQILRELTQS